MEIILCPVTGFCAGVKRALDITERVIQSGKRPIFILHDLVHNEKVVSGLLARGVRIVNTPDGLPSGAVLVFSAHGVSGETERHARSLPLEIIDATCPLVHRVHQRGAELSGDGYHVLLFGKRGHREVEGILGRIPGDKTLLTCEDDASAFVPDPSTKYACISQTTMSLQTIERMQNVLLAKIPSLVCAASVCQATRERQNAVRELARTCDVVLVAGSDNSSNTRRLCEIAAEEGARAVLVSDLAQVTPALLGAARRVGIASGASAPADFVAGIADICRTIADESPKGASS